MKRLIITFLLLFSAFLNGYAQVSSYQFTALSGTFTPVSTSATSVSAVVTDDAFSASIPIGFSFSYNGNSYTSLFANSNGFLSFKATATATASQQRNNTTTNVANVGPAVFPLWDDGVGYSTAPALSTAKYEVTGVQGSQVFTFEWKNWVWFYTSSNVAATISFQVKLYESTNVIEFIYQQESNNTLNAPAATIGLGGSTATDYLVLNSSGTAPTASSSSFTSIISTRPATGQVYRFTPPPPCVAPTAQPTALNFMGISATGISGYFAAASPAADRYLVVRTTSNTQPTPVNGNTYTIGNNTPLGGYVELAGTATSFSSTGLASGTQYYYWVFAYNSLCSGGPLYYTVSPLTGSATTGASIVSASSGSWNTTTTWVNGIVPSANDEVTIAAGHTVSLSAATGNANTLTTAATGVLSLNGGTLTIGGGSASGISNSGTINLAGGNMVIGATGANNRRLLNNSGGTLNVSGGTLTVYGNVAINNGSNFTQSDGTISVDGNNGGVTTNSVATGTPIFAIGTTSVQRSAGTVSLTGGTLILVDPHTGSGSNDMAFYYNGLVGTAYNIVASSNHTLQFGDGVSTDAGGGTTYQFGFNFWAGESAFTPGNVIVATLTGTNRIVRSRYTPYIIGNNLLISSGEFQDVSSTTSPDNKLHLGGSISVNTGGILTTGGSISLDYASYDANFSYTVSTGAITAARSISGNGVIRNSATSPTANFSVLSVNNTVGITSLRSLSVSDSLKLNNPVLDLGNDTITIGISATAPGVYIQSLGYVKGAIKRWISPASGTRSFNLGTAAGVKTAAINFTTAPTTGGSLVAEWVSNNSGTSGLPLTEGAIAVTTTAQEGFWRLTAGDGLSGGVYTGSFTAANLTGVNDYTQLVLLKRPNAAASWALDGIHVTTTGTNALPILSRSGMTGFSDFGVGGSVVNPLPITLLSFSGSRQGAVNRIFWTTATEKENKEFVLERSADGQLFEPLSIVPSKGEQGTSGTRLEYSYDDVAPIAPVSYYRLIQVNYFGEKSYTAVIELRASPEHKGYDLSLYPNPAHASLQVVVNVLEAEDAQIRVVDVMGREVMKSRRKLQSGNNALSLDVSSLPVGTYYLMVQHAGANEMASFLKE